MTQFMRKANDLMGLSDYLDDLTASSDFLQRNAVGATIGGALGGVTTGLLAAAGVAAGAAVLAGPGAAVLTAYTVAGVGAVLTRLAPRMAPERIETIARGTERAGRYVGKQAAEPLLEARGRLRPRGWRAGRELHRGLGAGRVSIGA